MESSAAGAKVKYIGNYLLDKTLGQGNFGKVKLATHLLTGEQVAVKIISKSKLTDTCDKQRLYREIRVMKLLNHQNIVNLFEVIDTPRHIYMVMEYANGGELFDYIIAREHVEEDKARVFFRQIVSGVDYCHRMDIIHRDLKPENLLLDYQQNIKIIDFGFTNHLKPDSLLETFCGSYSYAAPEMIAHRPYLGPEVDIWSIGVILFALLTGELPFDSSDVNRLYLQMKQQDYSFPSELNISREAKHLIRRMLDPNPQRRSTMEDIRKHPWLNKGFSGPPERSNMFGTQVTSIDDNVLAELVDMGFDGEAAAAALKKGEHNKVTATYRLLLERQQRNPNFTTKNTKRKGTSSKAPGRQSNPEKSPPSEPTAVPSPQKSSSSNSSKPTKSPSEQSKSSASKYQWLEEVQEALQNSRRGAVEIRDEILANVMFVIKNPENGLVQDHHWRGELHVSCIIGCEIVDWMMRTMALSLKECVKLGQVMFDRAFILPVVENDPLFRDEEFLYRFPTVQQRVERLKVLQKQRAQKAPSGNPGAGTVSGSNDNELAQQISQLTAAVAAERQRHAEVSSKLRKARLDASDAETRELETQTRVKQLEAELAVYKQNDESTGAETVATLKQEKTELLARIAAKDALLASNEELIQALKAKLADQQSNPPPSTVEPLHASGRPSNAINDHSDTRFLKFLKFANKTPKSSELKEKLSSQVTEEEVEGLRLYIRKLEKLEIRQRLSKNNSMDPPPGLSELEILLSPLKHTAAQPISEEGKQSLNRIAQSISSPQNMLVNPIDIESRGSFMLFNAPEAVDWLMRNFYLSEKHAVILCEMMRLEGLIKSIKPQKPANFQSVDCLYGVTNESKQLEPRTEPAPGSPEASVTKKTATKDTKQPDEKVCSNCMVTETTMWYGPSKDYGILCSACFRFWRSSGGSHRPVSESVKKQKARLAQIGTPKKTGGLFNSSHKGSIPVRSIRSGAFNAYRRVEMKGPKIIKTIITALGKKNISYKLNGYVFTCRKGDITFEIEVCRLQELNSNGVRLKRFTGDTFKYKKIVQAVLNKLKVA